MKTEEMEITISTLEAFAALINANEEWNTIYDDIIAANGWKDETGKEFGICSNGRERLEFDENAVAVVNDIK